MPRRTLFLLLLCFVSRLLWSQQVTMYPVQRGVLSFTAREKVTAVAVKADSYLGESVSVYMNAHEVTIPLDPDAPDFTYFLSLPEPISNATIRTQTGVQCQLYLINSGTAPSVRTGSMRLHQDDCSFDFNVIQQSEWREGLPAPSYSRSFTDVKHVVVHHSAGSNSNTNYTQVVRDIYIFHTEVNGWSDIGYNYLIAQDGTIYAGRDPGDDGAQDDVLGAHFCGSNSTTMGICLLGNYEAIEPTNHAWNSLQQVTAFKLAKESLDPLGTYNHPFGNLGAIIGHRDGCSTLCPGQNIYEDLDELRQAVDIRLDKCQASLDYAISNTNPQPGEEVLITNNSEGYTLFKWIFEGGQPDTAYWIGNGAVKYTMPGAYDVTLIGFRQNTSDTLFTENAVHVEAPPAISPNPIDKSGTFTIAANEPPQEVLLYGVSGKAYPLYKVDTHAYLLPNLAGGVYFVKFASRGKIYSKKLIVR